MEPVEEKAIFWTPLARMASSTLKVAIVFCSRSLRGCSRPKRTSAFAARWNTISEPRLGSFDGIEEVAFDEAEVRMLFGARNSRARREIVITGDRMALLEEPVDQVTADEARGTSEEDVHGICSRSRWVAQACSVISVRTALRMEGRMIQNTAPGSEARNTTTPKATDSAMASALVTCPVLPIVATTTASRPPQPW